jgi:hypothetical protein
MSKLFNSKKLQTQTQCILNFLTPKAGKIVKIGIVRHLHEVLLFHKLTLV